MPSTALADTTVQLTADDLISLTPITTPTSPEPTIQLTAADVLVLEGVATTAAAEVIVAPSQLLAPLTMAERLLQLWRDLRFGAARLWTICWRALGRAAVISWNASRRSATATRQAAGPLLRAIGRRCRSSAATGWTGLRNNGLRAWDLSFPLRDWLQLKLRKSTRQMTGKGSFSMRAVGPSDRALVEDLQRALCAYSSGAGQLQVAEVDGRVAIVVPGREAKVEVSPVLTENQTESTLMGRELLTSTR